MSIILRDYQEETVKQVFDAAEELEADMAFGEIESDTIVVDAPVSFGKSIVFLEAAKRLADKGEKVLIVMPIKPLIEQFVNTAKDMNIELGIIAAGIKDSHPNANIKVCMLQTLKNRVEKGAHDEFKGCWILQDELHKFAKTGTIVSIKDKLGYVGRIGMSGTPYNAFGYALENVYKLIKTVEPKDLIANGAWHHNVKYRVANFSEKIDFDKIKITSSGDFDQNQLNEIIETDVYINNVVQVMIDRNLQNKKTLVFTSSIDMAERLNKALQSNSFFSAVIHSKQKKKHTEALVSSFRNQSKYIDPFCRDAVLPEFENDEFIVKCMINVNILSTGFSDDDIEALVIATSIGSRSKEAQICGRLFRSNKDIDEKVIIDCGSNISRFGFGYDTFTPVNRTEDKRLDKTNLARENAKWSLPLLSEFLSDDLTTEISREWYDSKLDNLRAIENSIFNDDQEKELAQKRTGSSNRDIDPEEVRIKHEQDMAKNMAMVLRTTDDLEHLAKAYIWFWMYVNGSPISKAGHPYIPKIEWFIDKWEADMNKYPEVRNRFIKALKTRAKNIIKEGKNINSLSFFTNFLLTNYENEIQQQDEYKQLQFGSEENNVMDEISKEECPF